MGLLDKLDQSSMTEEQKAFFKEFDVAFNAVMEDGIKDYLNSNIQLKELEKKFSDVEDKLKQLSEKDFGDKFDKKEFDEMMLDIKGTLIALKASTEKGKDGKVSVKSIESQIEDQLKDFVKKDGSGREYLDLKGACKASDNGKRKKIHIIATKDAVTTAGANLIAGVAVDPSISAPPRAESDIRDYANVAQTSSRSLTYGELYDVTGDAEWVPEGGLKPSMNAKVREVTVNAGKVALTVKLTEETLADLPQLVAEVRSEVLNRIGIAEEEGILYGDGTNGEIVGVFNDIPEFTLTGLSVDKPNNFDAIIAAYTQIASVSKLNYRPNLVRVNPIDLANMKLTKDDNGQYLFPPFSLANGEIISGLRIVPSNSMELGEFVIGDFRYLNIRDYINLSVEFGWENDDFTKNMVTMIAEKRLLAYIKSNYLTAFVKGNYNTIKEAIDSSNPTT